MFNKTALTATLAAILIGTTSMAQAASDNTGDYKGGALYGPLPGQISGLRQGGTAYGYAGPRYGYAGPGGPYAYAGPQGLIDPTEGPNSAGHYRDHWEEYLTPELVR